MLPKQFVLINGSNPSPSLNLNFAANPAIPAGLTATRTTIATCMAYAPTAVSGDLPLVTAVAINEMRFQNARRVSQGVWSNVLNDGSAIPLPITLLAEEARSNLLLNSATPATQNITTTAQTYTISMWGTGTCTLTGTATGTLTGTSATTRVSLTVTATAGTLTLTFAGTNTNGQAEAGASMSSYIVTVAAAVTRTADDPSFTGAGLSWYNPQQGTFVVEASGQYSSAPGNIGVWNPLLTGDGSYAITYNKSQDNNAYLYLPNAAAGVNPLEYQDTPTPTTILLGEQGILNISRWTYYPKAFKPNKVMSLVSGTLTTSFDVSYAAMMDFTSLFTTTTAAFGTRTKYFPKVNTAAGITFTSGWAGNTGLTQLPLLNTIAGVTFTSSWSGDTALTTVKAGMFDNAKSIAYANAFLNCALTQASVDNILVSIAQSVVNTPTLIGGTLNMTGGTSVTPSATGLAGKNTLVTTYNWTVTNNEYNLSWDAVANTYTRTSGAASTPTVTTIHTGMKRCLLNDDRTVNYYLNPTDSALKADGSASVLTGADGMVMVEIPKFYYKHSKVGNVHDWAISAIPQVGYTLHPAFILDGVEVAYRYMGSYDACVWTTGTTYESGLNYEDNVGAGQNWNTGTAKLASVSGIYPATGINRAETRTLAANRGTSWRQTDYDLHSAIQLLYLVEYGSFDSQTKIGAGNTVVALAYPAASANQTDSPHSIAGKSNSIGNATGAVASTLRDTAWMSYRGIENLFGNCWNWVDGINVNSGETYIINNNTRANLADDTATGYTSVGIIATSSNWIADTMATGSTFLPATVSATTTLVTDNYYYTIGWRTPLVGGPANSASEAGVFYMHCAGSFSLVARNRGARLVC